MAARRRAAELLPPIPAPRSPLKGRILHAPSSGSFNHNEDSLRALKQHELLQELSRWGVHAGCGHRDPVLGIKADNKASRIRRLLEHHGMDSEARRAGSDT